MIGRPAWSRSTVATGPLAVAGGGRGVGVEMQRETLPAVASFDDGGRGPEPRQAGGLQRLERAGNS